jgi:hypothetical protein
MRKESVVIIHKKIIKNKGLDLSILLIILILSDILSNASWFILTAFGSFSGNLINLDFAYSVQSFDLPRSI